MATTDGTPVLAALADRAMRAAAVVLMLALLAAVVTGVVSRLFNRPVTWSDEAAQYLLVWTGFVGMMIAARKRSHIRIDVVIDLLPRGARMVAEILIQLLVIAFAGALLWWGWPLIPRNWDIEWVSLPVSAALLYVPIPFAAVALLLQALSEIRDALAGRLHAAPAPGEMKL